VKVEDDHVVRAGLDLPLLAAGLLYLADGLR
jgi:hypothetical protein